MEDPLENSQEQNDQKISGTSISNNQQREPEDEPMNVECEDFVEIKPDFQQSDISKD